MNPPNMIDQVQASPSLIWVAATICLHIINVFIGLSLGFQKKTPSLVRTHLLVYGAVLFSLASYLVINGIHHENTIWDYLVALYFITIIPLSRKWDVVLHAGITVMGLVFLPALILLQLL
ncbi:hypothetical protein [Nitrospina watsonii]|uniref:Integral membrane protein n=1 Tax=Nitrospina watsonii TaxID=1323948 RepID=A0ABN8VTM1_9BACT|nr:hypothetical protein [Nitrospina watsonii]CAI2717230.1 conserved membrane protein of unknown function [Nitrospina watsonii]